MGKNRNIDAWERAIIPTAVLVIILLILAVSCSPRITERIITVTRDTTIVDIRERIVHDTAYVKIPEIIEKNVTRDDSSHLENKFAVSDAWIQDGLLHHSLLTKPQTIDVPVDVPVTDTTTTHEHYESNDSTNEEYVEVEKTLSWWESFQLDTFWWFAVAAVGLAAWTFRHPMLNLLRGFTHRISL